MVEWKDIEKVNGDMELFTMERKQYNSDTKKYEMKEVKYAEVKERVIAFRKLYPNGKIATSYTTTENYIVFEAIVSDSECNILATGYAREYAKNEYAMEKAETSAIGRALGFCGLGIKTSIASKEDIDNYEDSQIFSEAEMEKEKKLKEETITKFNKLSNTQKANILNLFHVDTPETIDTKTLVQLVNNAK